MDNRAEVRQFLVTRRSKITPQQAGLAAYGTKRRVKGLRREEVAMLAGVSVEYYARLERGGLAGVSSSVLEALAKALQLNEAEHAHLLDLARTAASSAPARRRRRVQEVRPGIQRLLDALVDAPAFIFNGRLDLLATNALARSLYSPVFDNPANRANLARFCMLDPHGELLYPDWDAAAATTVNLLRAEAGRDPYNRELTALVGELSTRSEEFRTRWAQHDVRLHHSGTKRFHHPVVGELVLAFEAMPLPGDPGLTLNVYTAEPGTTTYDNLKLLASWAASRSDNDAETASESADSAR